MIGREKTTRFHFLLFPRFLDPQFLLSLSLECSSLFICLSVSHPFFLASQSFSISSVQFVGMIVVYKLLLHGPTTSYSCLWVPIPVKHAVNIAVRTGNKSLSLPFLFLLLSNLRESGRREREREREGEIVSWSAFGLFMAYDVWNTYLNEEDQ